MDKLKKMEKGIGSHDIYYELPKSDLMCCDASPHSRTRNYVFEVDLANFRPIKFI